MESLHNYLKRDQIEEAVDFMDELNITNDMFKEHFLSLCMDKKLQEKFDKLSTQTKSAFTRRFNSTHRKETVPVKKSGAKQPTAADLDTSKAEPEADEKEEEEEEFGLVDADEDEV